jgi:hypothetical protein
VPREYRQKVIQSSKLMQWLVIVMNLVKINRFFFKSCTIKISSLKAFKTTPVHGLT